MEKGYHISCFKKGDLIYRCQPVTKTKTQHNEVLGIDVEVRTGQDNSFRERPIEFVCVENGIIYAKSPVKDRYLDRQFIYKLLLDEYGDNWMYYTIPEGLTIEDCM